MYFRPSNDYLVKTKCMWTEQSNTSYLQVFICSSSMAFIGQGQPLSTFQEVTQTFWSRLIYLKQQQKKKREQENQSGIGWLQAVMD